MKKFISVLLCTIITLSFVNAYALETITIGATPVPHALILEHIKPAFEALGYKLNIQVGTDYYIFNNATADKDTDANFFQHKPFLDSTYNKEASEDNKLEAVFAVHYEPMGLFPGKLKSIEDIKDGIEIAIPNDPSNSARALLLLQEIGWIKLPENAFENGVAVSDIIENKYNIKFSEMNADIIPNSIEDVDYAVINGNYAIAAGFKSASDAIAIESKDSEAAKQYANYVVVRAEDKDKQWVKDLEKVLLSDELKEYLNTEKEFSGAVLPIF